MCPSRLASGSARLLAASASTRQGVGCAGHPCSGNCSQGDGRLSRVPGLPFCSHAPLSDPGGVPSARLDADRTAIRKSGFTRRMAAANSSANWAAVSKGTTEPGSGVQWTIPCSGSENLEASRLKNLMNGFQYIRCERSASIVHSDWLEACVTRRHDFWTRKPDRQLLGMELRVHLRREKGIHSSDWSLI